IRAYKVSLSIVLQSIAQLSARYGRETSQAILGGFNTLLTYSGSDPETCRFFESVCGKVRERQRRDLLSANPQDSYREFNLVNADEIRTLQRRETVIVSTNRNPARIVTSAYFETRTFKKLSALGATSLKSRAVNVNDITLVRL
ncbi:MAG: type IV secretory system conjugative DNA transfer family protein, partial [Hyphomicrobium sp.]